MKEFIDFLGGQSPYDALDVDDLEQLAASVEAEYFAAGARIVPAGSEPLRHLWVVRAGSVEVFDGDRLVDQLRVGDTFGHVSLYSGEPPVLSVVAAEDCLLYRLADPRPLLRRHDRLRFVRYGALTQADRLAESPIGMRDRAVEPVTDYARALVLVDSSTSIRKVAEQIGDQRQSCAVVRYPDHQLGIVTDADFRSRVAVGQINVDDEVGSLASRPALTVPEETEVATAFLEMLEHGVHHLVLADDGGRPVGVVRVVDLASAEVRDPLVIRAAVDSAGTLEDLAQAVSLLGPTAVELFDAGVPAVRIGALSSAILDSVLRRLLALRPMDVGVEVSWLVLGSLARREVLPTSDVDTAIVYADLADADSADADAVDADSPHPSADLELGAIVRAAAAGVLDDLEKTGLRRCPDGANADTERFCRSMRQWRHASSSWIRNAGLDGALLLSTMLADSRPVSTSALGHQVSDQMLAIVRSPQFLKALLDYTLSARPPTGFVRDFVVEHSGEHRGQLNLKRGGLRPVTSIGRWTAVVTGDNRGTTPERLRRAAEASLLTEDESESLIGAHEQVYSLLLEMEVEALRTASPVSTYIDPGDLDSLTRRHLRESFRAIGAVQNRLESSWQGRIPGTSG